jgi:hypothetical protein
MDMAFSGEVVVEGIARDAEQAVKKIAVSQNRVRMD